MINNFNKQIAILLENLESEKKFLEDNDYEWIDDVQLGNYLLFLIKSAEGNYEVGITSFDEEFTSFQAQEKRPAKDSLHKHLKTILSTLTHWLNRYKLLFVGSFNKERTELYYRVFSKMFKCSVVEYCPPEHGLPESWNFTIEFNN